MVGTNVDMLYLKSMFNLICSIVFENVSMFLKFTSYADIWRKQIWWDLAEITKLLSNKL